MAAFRPHPDVLTRRIDDDIVLVHMGRNEIFSLNATGARLWEILAEGRTLAEAVDLLQAEFDVSAGAARHDAEQLIDTLAREGLADYDEEQ